MRSTTSTVCCSSTASRRSSATCCAASCASARRTTTGSRPLKIAFFGSGRFAVPSLRALAEGPVELVGVVTQPDRPRGRGRSLAPPPTGPVAEELGVPRLQPRRVREPEALDAIRALGAELHVVVAYGQILPRALLDVPSRGSVNVHGSLLPRYRGAAPVQWAIASGETQTGVSTMLMDEGLDTGPVLLQRALEIGRDETAAELEPRLAALGAAILLETVAGLAAGALEPTPQNDVRATLAPLLRKVDGVVDWRRPARVTADRIRGFRPWPGAAARLDGKLLLLQQARAAPGGGGAAGEILDVSAGGVRVACGDASSLLLVEVQPESRRPMAAVDWARGARIAPGRAFDPPARDD